MEHMRNNSKEVMYNPMYHTRHDRVSINSDKGDKQAAVHAGAPELEPDPSTPRRWYNAVIPIAVTILLGKLFILLIFIYQYYLLILSISIDYINLYWFNWNS